jgi:hypothetical protein
VTSKLILIAIALGLWVNAAALWLQPAQPARAESDNYYLRTINCRLDDINTSLVHLDDINTNLVHLVRGECENRKICR